MDAAGVFVCVDLDLEVVSASGEILKQGENDCGGNCQDETADEEDGGVVGNVGDEGFHGFSPFRVRDAWRFEA